MKFRDFIHAGSTIVPLRSADRDGAIGELVSSLGENGAIEASAIAPLAESLVARERVGTTGFGRGVAVPHAKDPRVGRMVAAIGVSAGGLDFGALDGKPVYTVIVLLSPKGRDDDHVRAMEVAFRALNQEPFRRALRQATTADQVRCIVDEADTASSTIGRARRDAWRAARRAMPKRESSRGDTRSARARTWPTSSSSR